jgi:MoxR-like ATPase
LQAISYQNKGPVLLIDEIDRADEEFEAFLLEVLSDFQVSIPELGTIKAENRPFVVLTSNRTRELSDALKRRCLYLWIDYPDFTKEFEILKAKVPGVNEVLAAQVAVAMRAIRRLKLAKVPGVAETINWAMSLMALHQDHLDRESLEQTLGTFLKDRDDVSRLRGQQLDVLVKSLDGLTVEELRERADNIAEHVAKEMSTR